jgi:hypothetical protein
VTGFDFSRSTIIRPPPYRLYAALYRSNAVHLNTTLAGRSRPYRFDLDGRQCVRAPVRHRPDPASRKPRGGSTCQKSGSTSRLITTNVQVPPCHLICRFIRLNRYGDGSFAQLQKQYFIKALVLTLRAHFGWDDSSMSALLRRYAHAVRARRVALCRPRHAKWFSGQP